MNIEQARFNMIQQQIRPWNVLNQDILNLLTEIKREKFVPKIYKHLTFFDIEIPLPGGENMLLPKIEARMLQAANIKKHEYVLEIGTGSGYMAALLAYQAKHVTTVEINPELKLLAEKNCCINKIMNLNIQLGDGMLSWKDKYDIIIISGGLPFLPKILLQQIKINGRILAIIGKPPIMTLKIVTRLTKKTFNVIKIFELLTKSLHLTTKCSTFSF